MASRVPLAALALGALFASTAFGVLPHPVVDALRAGNVPELVRTYRAALAADDPATDLELARLLDHPKLFELLFPRDQAFYEAAFTVLVGRYRRDRYQGEFTERGRDPEYQKVSGQPDIATRGDLGGWILRALADAVRAEALWTDAVHATFGKRLVELLFPIPEARGHLAGALGQPPMRRWYRLEDWAYSVLVDAREDAHTGTELVNNLRYQPDYPEEPGVVRVLEAVVATYADAVYATPAGDPPMLGAVRDFLFRVSGKLSAPLPIVRIVAMLDADGHRWVAVPGIDRVLYALAASGVVDDELSALVTRPSWRGFAKRVGRVLAVPTVRRQARVAKELGDARWSLARCLEELVDRGRRPTP